MTMILDSAHLVPETWTDGSAESCYVFNPAIVMIHGRFIMAYRVVTADGVRRVAISELDAVSLQPKTETIVPLSDLIQDGGQWCADPRFCTFGERLFIHYNDGWRIPNQISYWNSTPIVLFHGDQHARWCWKAHGCRLRKTGYYFNTTANCWRSIALHHTQFCMSNSLGVTGCTVAAWSKETGIPRLMRSNMVSRAAVHRL